MSVATITSRPVASQPLRTGLNAKWHNVMALTRRNIIHITREPLQLSDVTVQPILFTLLFVFVFGSGVPIPGGLRELRDRRPDADELDHFCDGDGSRLEQ